MNRWIAVAVLYIAGCFMTNAYCQVYRLDEWERMSPPNLNTQNLRIFMATVVWPAYWTSRGCIWLVQHPPCFQKAD